MSALLLLNKRRLLLSREFYLVERGEIKLISSRSLGSSLVGAGDALGAKMQSNDLNSRSVF